MRFANFITTIAVCAIFSTVAGSAQSDEPQAKASSVYAKVILLSDHTFWNQVGLREPVNDELPKVAGVESWIAEQVSDERRLRLKAATNWILLPENVEQGKLIFRG